MKLKHKDVKTLRENLLREQSGICPLCETQLSIEDAVLDHNHKTGSVRATIHRNCNLYLGKLENNIQRNRITEEQLVNILKNYREYVVKDVGFIHPTHKTAEEKKLLAKKRRARRR